jgi:hypothetical protein
MVKALVWGDSAHDRAVRRSDRHTEGDVLQAIERRYEKVERKQSMGLVGKHAFLPADDTSVSEAIS